MTSIWDETTGKLSIFRDNQLVVVYQRDTQPGVRSIGNCITELYAPDGPGRNLLRDDSCLVPPQTVALVNDEFIKEGCSNEPTSSACDYFCHHKPLVEILQTLDDAVRFRVRTERATQHNDRGTSIAYAATLSIGVPFHPQHTVIEYDVRTSLTQPIHVGHALRPLPLFELVNQRYEKVSYLSTNRRDVITIPIPTLPVPTEVATIFLRQSPVCDDRPWVALYRNDVGNLGMILQSWAWTHGSPELLSATEIINHLQEPNLYFQSSDHSRQYDTGEWRGRLVFVSYTGDDYTPVQQLRNQLAQDSTADVATPFFKAISQGSTVPGSGGLVQFFKNNRSFYRERGRGFNVAAIDAVTGELLRPVQNFDTWGTRDTGTAMRAMISFLDSLRDGTFIMMAVGDEAGLNQFPPKSCAHWSFPWVEEGLRAIEQLGSTHLRDYCYRDSWSMIAVKGERRARDERLGHAVEVAVGPTLLLP